MGLQILPQKVMEKSSVKITCAFKDTSDASAVLPLTVNWKLTELDGTVLSSGGETPATSVDIWLSDSQLALVDNTKPYELRIILIEATYNNGLAPVPLKHEGKFAIYNIAGVS